jgi:2,4-dienoyl-CoA reductase-like NADH-dependent reductase (Old Yellow Enzyme family)
MYQPSVLQQPLTLPCGHIIPNRIIKGAMTEGIADRHDNATKKHQTLYRTWSKGETGVLISGNILIDRRYLERAGNVVVEDESGLPQLKAWVAATKEGKSQLWAQINHPGRQCPRMVSTKPLSASDVQLNMIGNFAKPKAASLEDIQDVIQRFANTAKIVQKAGFEGVQIHAAHGYFLSQFLSPNTNKRNDQYGGSLENRARILLEVIAAVRAQVGDKFPIAVKLNSSDFQKGGFTLEECVQVVEWLNDAGIDLLEISGGTYEQLEFLKEQPIRESTKKREAFFLEYAKSIKAVAKMPLVVTGGFRSKSAMEEALNEGVIDAIGIARPFCMNPDFPKNFFNNEISELPNDEGKLVIGNGYWGPTSSSKSIQALNNQAHAGWYYHQIERLAKGLPPQDNYSPRKALFAHLSKDMGRAILRKF